MTMKLNIYLVSDETEMRIEISTGVLNDTSKQRGSTRVPKTPQSVASFLVIFSSCSLQRNNWDAGRFQTTSSVGQTFVWHASPHSCWK